MTETAGHVASRIARAGPRVGDRILVNVAPFIGSPRRQRDAVSCRVLQVEGPWVRVCTECPCRDMDVWVSECWIEALLDRADLCGSTGV
ncbi:MAG: hypothetical protein MUF48_04965 [Pirellulaceae bacterium]|jgi:hypothetical protein|nr:hypothetical protein [Pirellulaceae bacterium]